MAHVVPPHIQLHDVSPGGQQLANSSGATVTKPVAAEGEAAQWVAHRGLRGAQAVSNDLDSQVTQGAVVKQEALQGSHANQACNCLGSLSLQWHNTTT